MTGVTKHGESDLGHKRPGVKFVKLCPKAGDNRPDWFTLACVEPVQTNDAVI